MLDWVIIPFLGLIAGFIGTNTGGMSLVVTPCLIFLGLPVPQAIATARLGGLGTMLAGVRHFHAAGKIDHQLGWKVAVLSVMGTFIGAPLIKVLPPHVLKLALGIVSLIVLTLMILRRRGVEPARPSRLLRGLGFASIPIVAAIGSVTGGQSMLIAYIFVFFFGKTFIEAAGTRKIVGLCSAAVSIAIFSSMSCIDWPRGLLLATANATGAHFGAQIGLRSGEKWVARGFYCMAALASVRLLVS